MPEPKRSFNRLNLLVYPTYGSGPASRTFFAKWRRAAKETRANQKALMVVVARERINRKNEAEFPFLRELRRILGRRLIVVSGRNMVFPKAIRTPKGLFQPRISFKSDKNMISVTKSVLRARGFRLEPNLRISAFGQHWGKSFSNPYCIARIAREFVEQIAPKAEFEIDFSRSIRDMRDAIYWELLKINPSWTNNVRYVRGRRESGDLEGVLNIIAYAVQNRGVSFNRVLKLAAQKANKGDPALISVAVQKEAQKMEEKKIEREKGTRTKKPRTRELKRKA